MNIIIKDDMAYVHYFERTGQPGYQSVGRSADDGVISINQEDQITVPVAALVSVCEAGYAGAEFYKTLTMPTAIECYEL